MQGWEQVPYYMFFIIRPDGNSAYSKIHEHYPLNIETDQLLGVISLFSAVNNLQTSITHPSIVTARKDQIDLAHKNSVKSLTTSTFQIRAYDNISGYRFVLVAHHQLDGRKLDSKLEEIYKIFVNYVIKVPFLNVLLIFMPRKIIKQKINSLSAKVIKSSIDDLTVDEIQNIFCYMKSEQKKEHKGIYIYASVDIDKAYRQITSKSKKIKEYLEDKHLNYQFIEQMRVHKNLRICFDNEIQKFIFRKELNADLKTFKKNVFEDLQNFIVSRYDLYLEDQRLREQYNETVTDIKLKFEARMKELMKKV